MLILFVNMIEIYSTVYLSKMILLLILLVIIIFDLVCFMIAIMAVVI